MDGWLLFKEGLSGGKSAGERIRVRFGVDIVGVCCGVGVVDDCVGVIF